MVKLTMLKAIHTALPAAATRAIAKATTRGTTRRSPR
jgi:hypothetical protein